MSQPHPLHSQMLQNAIDCLEVHYSWGDTCESSRHISTGKETSKFEFELRTSLCTLRLAEPPLVHLRTIARLFRRSYQWRHEKQVVQMHAPALHYWYRCDVFRDLQQWQARLQDFDRLPSVIVQPGVFKTPCTEFALKECLRCRETFAGIPVGSDFLHVSLRKRSLLRQPDLLRFSICLEIQDRDMCTYIYIYNWI